MDPNTALTAAVGVLVTALGAFLEGVRRGAWVPRFVYDREVQRGDLSDARADKLEAAVDALTRAVNDLSHDRRNPPPGTGS